MMEGLLPHLSISYDECRRPKTGHPRGGSGTIKKTSLPAVSWRGPVAGVLCIEDDFHGSGANV